MTLDVPTLKDLEEAIKNQADAIESVCIQVEEGGMAKEYAEEIAYLIWTELGNVR